MTQKISKAVNRPAVIAAFLLFALAAITYWDASQMASRATYGINASAASYAVAALLVMLGLSHLVSAVRPTDGEGENLDWRAVGWIALALGGMIGAVALGGGFILGSTLLFACTARAFGRNAFVSDLCIGAGLGAGIFLFFSKLLALTLPQGPLERIF
jgi:putative tricarboxylic transport membrane protein